MNQHRKALKMKMITCYIVVELDEERFKKNIMIMISDMYDAEFDHDILDPLLLVLHLYQFSSSMISDVGSSCTVSVFSNLIHSI